MRNGLAACCVVQGASALPSEKEGMQMMWGEVRGPGGGRGRGAAAAQAA